MLSTTVLLYFAASAVAVSSSACSKRWCQFSVTGCLNESLASARWSAANVQGCLMKASSPADPDDPVAQWNSRTGVCSLFSYQSVCRLAQAFSDGGGGGSGSCSAYRAAALGSCGAKLNSRLLGVWLAGGGRSFGNLVCQSQPANFSGGLVGANLQMTDEGASFNGVSSYAMLNDSRFFDSNTSAGFTWLMRLKREPRIQPFMELTPCNDLNTYGHHFWEFSSINQLSYNKAGWDSDVSNFVMLSAPNVLPANSTAWINIGISIGRTHAESAFFYNQGFIGHVPGSQYISPRSACYFLVIGGRIHNGFYYLKGLVRAVAVANYTMTEQEIREFFAALP